MLIPITDGCLFFVSIGIFVVAKIAAFVHNDGGCEQLTYKYSSAATGSGIGSGRGLLTPTFYSPRFPQPYQPGVQCIMYRFVGDAQHIVQLTFLEFDLQLPRSTRCMDYLRLYLDLDPNDQQQPNDLTRPSYELCGNISTMPTKQYYSSTSTLVMWFHTGLARVNNTGFRGIYRFIEKAQFQLVGGSKRWGAACTYDFHSRMAKAGRFFSPRYPQPYEPSSLCNYVFMGQRHERVRVTFHNIQLEAPPEGSTGCTNSPDQLIVRDGQDTSSAVVLAQFCGTSNSQSVTSSGEYLNVELVTDAVDQRQGFAAEFVFFSESPSIGPVFRPPPILIKNSEGPGSPTPDGGIVHETPADVELAISSTQPTEMRDANNNVNVTCPACGDSPCGQEFISGPGTSSTGTLSSPLFPDPYPAYITCRFVLRAPVGDRVRISFSVFELSYNIGDPNDTYGCTEVDSVTIMYSAADGIMKELGMFCGSKRPPSLMSTDHNMELVFHSRTQPETKNYRGFRATYEFVSDFGIKTGERDSKYACGFAFKSSHSPNGTFTSPNFPGIYPRNIECHYLFHGAENEKVHIKFHTFDVEGIDANCLEKSDSDYIELSNFNVGLSDRMMQRLCNSRPEPYRREIVSDSNFFRVTFRSNDIYDASGFMGEFQFRKTEEGSQNKQTRSPQISGSSSSLTTQRHSSPWLLPPPLYVSAVVVTIIAIFIQTISCYEQLFWFRPSTSDVVVTSARSFECRTGDCIRFSFFEKYLQQIHHVAVRRRRSRTDAEVHLCESIATSLQR